MAPCPFVLSRTASLTRRAFTLIELLVVISIIALLIGILLPVLGNAREAARQTRCLSNMRQMSIATINYTLDFRGEIPTIGLAEGGESLNEEESWLVLLQQYADVSDGLERDPLLYRCPSDSSPFFNSPAPSNGKIRRTGYALSNSLGLAPTFEKFRKIQNIPRPSKTIFALELAEGGPALSDDLGGTVSADHIHVEFTFTSMAVAGQAGDDEWARQVEIEQHLGRSNYAFLDGHAETLTREETILWTGSTRFGMFLTNLYWPQVAR